jgi:hypothetical protein
MVLTSVCWLTGFQAHSPLARPTLQVQIIAELLPPDSLFCFEAPAQPPVELANAAQAPDYGCLRLVRDYSIYHQGWDTLPQSRFWQQIIRLEGDTSLVSIARSRRVLARIASTSWAAKGLQGREAYKDSLRQALGLAKGEVLYVTAGKRFYYKIRETLPAISVSTEVFREEGTDPWYAQAILLIESPGANHRSGAGAYGAFQLMEGVARAQGLRVGGAEDERGDVEKAAGAAARFLRKVCLPEARAMLRAQGMDFCEDELWFRLFVLHVYHAGAGNLAQALAAAGPAADGPALIRSLWQTQAKGFKNASQNYSQIALAALLELDRTVAALPADLCEGEAGRWAIR